MQLEAAMVEFGYSFDYSRASRDWYASRLGAFVLWAKTQGVTEVEGLTTPLVRRYLDMIRTTPSKRDGKPLSSFTVHGHARAIRTLLFWAAREDLIDEKVARRVVMPKREEKVMAILSPHHMALLFKACEGGENASTVMRDKAILAVLFDTGIRASELCTLALDRVHFGADDAYLKVLGKGRKEREVPLGTKARQLLHRYVHRGRPLTSQPYVFVTKEDKPLTPEGLDRLLYRLRDRAGAENFQGVRVHAHIARHTYAVRSLEAGMDIYSVSRLMGHSGIEVTTGYAKAFTSRQARQRAVSVLDGLK